MMAVAMVMPHVTHDHTRLVSGKNTDVIVNIAGHKKLSYNSLISLSAMG